MNIFIFIRQFTIFINNKYVDKKIREIIKSKLVFYKDHNLLIYFKIVIIKLKTSPKITIEKINFSNFSKNLEFDDDLFNIENIQ